MESTHGLGIKPKADGIVPKADGIVPKADGHQYVSSRRSVLGAVVMSVLRGGGDVSGE